MAHSPTSHWFSVSVFSGRRAQPTRRSLTMPACPSINQPRRCLTNLRTYSARACPPHHSPYLMNRRRRSRTRVAVATFKWCQVGWWAPWPRTWILTMEQALSNHETLLTEKEDVSVCVSSTKANYLSPMLYVLTVERKQQQKFSQYSDYREEINHEKWLHALVAVRVLRQSKRRMKHSAQNKNNEDYKRLPKQSGTFYQIQNILI